MHHVGNEAVIIRKALPPNSEIIFEIKRRVEALERRLERKTSGTLQYDMTIGQIIALNELKAWVTERN